MSRLRGGELLALGGGVLLLVALFLPWFAASPPSAAPSDRVSGPELLPDGDVVRARVYAYILADATSSGWNSLGWLTLAIAAAAIALVAWLAIANLARRPIATTMASNVAAAVLGPIALLVLALRVLVFQPGPNDLVGLRYGAWLGLAGALALTIGAWWALADERTGAPESAYEPPPARPAPPERAS